MEGECPLRRIKEKWVLLVLLFDLQQVKEDRWWDGAKKQPCYWEMREQQHLQRNYREHIWGPVPRRRNLAEWFWTQTLKPNCVGFYPAPTTVWPQTRYLISLCLSSLACKMGRTYLRGLLWGFNASMCGKHLEQYLAQFTHWKKKIGFTIVFFSSLNGYSEVYLLTLHV